MYIADIIVITGH